jgi:signal transduction histidine kinase
VLRSLRWSAERLLPWCAAAAVGLTAEESLYRWADTAAWVPDLLTGWALIAFGLFARTRRRRRPAAFLVAAGLAWFLPNFTPHLLYLHRGPLVQLVLTYPGGRPRRRWEAAAVVAGYGAALVTPVWASPTATIALAVLLTVAATLPLRSSVGRERRERVYALQATVFLASSLALTAAIHLASDTTGGNALALHLYQVTLVALALLLTAGLLQRPWERSPVTDLVVELGQRHSSTVRDALAHALGDRSLEVGYWLADAGAFVDVEGRPLRIPDDEDGRSVTFVEREGEPTAVLVHDPAVLGDPALDEAVAAVAKLAATNARLQAELRTRVTDVAASRRRVLTAGDEERDRLEHRLRQGARRRLDDLAKMLAAARATAHSQLALERLAQAERQLERIRGELTRFARGIYPRELLDEGLAAALASLARESPVPVRVQVEPFDVSAEVAACVYFVCAEALANVLKYASATSASVTAAASNDTVTVLVEDDGVGGAEASRGSGLRGLADRVETLGGTLSVDSPPGAGTRLTAALPVSA